MYSTVQEFTSAPANQQLTVRTLLSKSNRVRVCTTRVLSTRVVLQYYSKNNVLGVILLELLEYLLASSSTTKPVQRSSLTFLAHARKASVNQPSFQRESRCN
jgi:hypothetical protein